ncbi:hypothetical protein NXG61_08355 [Pectinatus haikarae]
MQKAISALKYAEHCGLPYPMVKQYCIEGIIPCFKRSVRYYIRPDIADEALAKYETQKLEPKPEKEIQVLKQPKDFNFFEALKNA